MTKYSAVNLNAGYRLNFKYSRNGLNVLVKIFLVICSIWIYIYINLLKTVADDLLQCEKIEKMVFMEIDQSESIHEW